MRLALLLLLLALPLWAQSPSPDLDHDHDHAPGQSCEEHGHDHDPTHDHGHDHHDHAAPDLEAGQEFVTDQLHAESDNAPALYKFMIRETNSEPFRLKGQSTVVWREAAIVWGLNVLIIVAFYRRRR